MTADASFRTRREALGLSAQWISEQLLNSNGEPTAIRTVQYWDAGGFPTGRTDELDALLDPIEDWIANEIIALEEAIEGLTSDDIYTMIVYLPRPKNEAALAALYSGEPPVPVETYWRFLALIELVVSWSGGIFGFLWVDTSDAAAWVLGDSRLAPNLHDTIVGYYIDGAVSLRL